MRAGTAGSAWLTVSLAVIACSGDESEPSNSTTSATTTTSSTTMGAGGTGAEATGGGGSASHGGGGASSQGGGGASSQGGGGASSQGGGGSSSQGGAGGQGGSAGQGGQGQGGSSGPGPCDPGLADTVCATCLKMHCCNELTACEGDANCTCWVQCLETGVSFAMCAPACGNPGQAANNVFGCANAKCMAPCPIN